MNTHQSNGLQDEEWVRSFQSDSDMVDGCATMSDSAVADFLRPHITR